MEDSARALLIIEVSWYSARSLLVYRGFPVFCAGLADYGIPRGCCCLLTSAEEGVILSIVFISTYQGRVLTDLGFNCKTDNWLII